MKDEVIVAFILGYFIGKISQKYGGVQPTAKKVIIFVIDAYDILFRNSYEIKNIKIPETKVLKLTRKEMFKRVIEQINKLKTK